MTEDDRVFGRFRSLVRRGKDIWGKQNNFDPPVRRNPVQPSTPSLPEKAKRERQCVRVEGGGPHKTGSDMSFRSQGWHSDVTLRDSTKDPDCIRRVSALGHFDPLKTRKGDGDYPS